VPPPTSSATELTPPAPPPSAAATAGDASSPTSQGPVPEEKRDLIRRLLGERLTLLDLFTSQYEVWIGYHAILQDNRRPMAPEGVEPDSLEKLLDAERAVVARMQVKQAMQVAELMCKVVERHQIE
jgi:hypothetical protein